MSKHWPSACAFVAALGLWIAMAGGGSAAFAWPPPPPAVNPGPPGPNPPPGANPPPPNFRPGRPPRPNFRPGGGPPGSRPDGWGARRRLRQRLLSRLYGGGVSVAYFPGSIWNPYAANYQAGGRAHHARNWRYVNVREFDALREDGYRSTDIKKALYYDRLESRDFPKALEDLSKGVFGALLSWPENPGLVSHSKALERLFLHLDMKLEVKLAYAEKASQAERMAYGQSLVRELLAKLVEQINIEGDQYLVRFKLNNGKRSPWVIMPVVFKTSGYGSVPSYKRGASYYQGPYEVFDASTASRN